MRMIALEEHWGTSVVEKALQTVGITSPLSLPALVSQKLKDLGAGRLADMDAAGIDVQVLSLAGTAGIDKLPPADATAIARECNDILASAVAGHPDRFAAFAFLAMQDPESAAVELERCVNSLGFKGVMINGTTNGLFLDDPRFYPVLAQAEKLNVPIYLHPAPPPLTVYEAYFSGLPENVGNLLSIAGWGWHVENGLHSLRLVLAGVFDRFPALQVIIGHMGENIPFSLARSNNVLTPVASHLERPVKDYFMSNFHITTSGYFTLPPLLCALMVFGADRMLFAVDYPFSSNTVGRAFLENAPITPADLEKIAHTNAERLLKITN